MHVSLVEFITTCFRSGNCKKMAKFKQQELACWIQINSLVLCNHAKKQTYRYWNITSLVEIRRTEHIILSMNWHYLSRVTGLMYHILLQESKIHERTLLPLYMNIIIVRTPFLKLVQQRIGAWQTSLPGMSSCYSRQSSTAVTKAVNILTQCQKLWKQNFLTAQPYYTQFLYSTFNSPASSCLLVAPWISVTGAENTRFSRLHASTDRRCKINRALREGD